MHKDFIDKLYIVGRDNYSCVFCHQDLTSPDPNQPLAKIFFTRLDPEQDWSNFNVITTCGEKCFYPDESPNLPLTTFTGRLILFTGVMFSAKSTTTRSYIEKYRRIKGEYIWIKPDVDSRGEGITTHNDEVFDAYVVSTQRPDQSLKKLRSYPIVAIDEVQFFSERMLYVIHQLLKDGVLVIANGLKLDSRRSFFGITHYLMAEADDTHVLKAICNVCGEIDVATRTKRKTEGGPSVWIGGSDRYFASCPGCDKEGKSILQWNHEKKIFTRIV